MCLIHSFSNFLDCESILSPADTNLLAYTFLCNLGNDNVELNLFLSHLYAWTTLEPFAINDHRGSDKEVTGERLVETLMDKTFRI
jgi:hypothetical protein